MIIDYQAGQFSNQQIFGRFGGASVIGVGPRVIIGQGGVIPPPVSNPIILGLTMIAQGLTVLTGLTVNLDKGLVEDEQNIITRT